MMNIKNKLWFNFFAFFTLSCFLFLPVQAEEKVKIYSDRIETLILPAFQAFEKETGIQVEYTTASSAALIERLKNEGSKTPADILITTDVGNLWQAAQREILRSVDSPVLMKRMSAHLRDKENRWFALTIRARTIIYSMERVSSSELSTYKALGDKKWRDRLCLRTSKKVYNKSLVASMIASKGKKEAEAIVGGWIKNNAQILPKDSSVIKAIAAGRCDVGIINTYYLGRELKNNSDYPVRLFWANQNERGVHVNVSGGGVVKHAKNVKNAILLLEFLTSDRGQKLFVEDNMEYPVNPEVAFSPLLVQWWGDDFVTDSLDLTLIGQHQEEATKLMNRLKYR